jgi:hypothetical protein
MKISTPPIGVQKYTFWKRMQSAIRYLLARTGWRLADWFITHSPQRMERVDQATKIEVYLLLDDSRSKWGMEQMTWELNSEQWAKLERMEAIILSLEVTDRMGKQRNLEAHFYEAPGNSACEALSMYAYPPSDAPPPPLGKRSDISIGKLLRGLLYRTDKAPPCQGSYPESDTTTNGGVQRLSQQTA